MPNLAHPSSVSAQSFFSLSVPYLLSCQAEESHGRVDACSLVLVGTNNIVRVNKKGNKSLLGKVSGRIYQHSAVQLTQVLHQVLHILRVGNVESLYLIRLFEVDVLLVVSLALLEDSLLSIAINNDSTLPPCNKIVGKQGTQSCLAYAASIR